MLFNSIDFAFFLPIVFFLYWFACNKSIKLQNILIVVSSYIFYGWWDAKFLLLIAFSTILDYLIGIKIHESNNNKVRKLYLLTSLFVNLGFLGFFKYFNFFIDNFTEAFLFFGYKFEPISLSIILPVGISFYTFQTLSYSIDIYKRKLTPTYDFTSFAAFVSFFPQLVAGPIERASNLLPQFYVKRKFEYNKAVDGLKQILWGFFKKMVIADNCAKFANQIFDNYTDFSGSTLFLGATFFAFQIYGDFSGYSDIAIGTSRLFGFNLKQNFAFPYFSRDIAEFWRRWHISLSTWFRDYLYIPLGGSEGSVFKKIRNVFIIFLVSGFWHGANWTFIFWGLINAIYFLPLLLLGKNRKNLSGSEYNKGVLFLKDIGNILITFFITVIAWVFFRSENISNAFEYISLIFNQNIFNIPDITILKHSFYLLLLLFFFNLVEWLGKNNQYAIEYLFINSKIMRRLFYCFIIFLIGIYMQTDEIPFIYFQF